MIKRNYFIYLFGEMLNKIFPFLLTPYISNSYGAHGFLKYSNVVVLFTFGLLLFSVPFSTYISVNYIKNKKRYLLSLSFSVITSKAILWICLFIFPATVLFVENFDVMYYIIAIICAACSIQSQVLLSVLQVRSEAVTYIIFSSLRNVILVVLVLFFYFGLGWNSIELFIFSFLCSAFINAIICSVYVTRYVHDSNLYHRVKNIYRILAIKLIFYGAPLLPTALINPLRTMFDRYIITYIYGATIAGVYAGYYQMSSIVVFYSASQVKTLSPLLLTYIRNREYDSFFRLIYRAFLSLFLFSTILSFALYYFCGTLLGDDFAPYSFFSFIPYFICFQCAAGYFTCFYQYHEMNVISLVFNVITLLVYFLLAYLFAVNSPIVFVVGIISSSLIFFIVSLKLVRYYVLVKISE